MKIAILGTTAAVNWYAANLMLRGHQVQTGFGGHVETSIRAMINDGIDGILKLSEDPEHDEIATEFSRRTGRPVWRELTEIPR